MSLTCHGTGVIELPILGESNNANLCQFRVIFLITTHRLGWYDDPLYQPNLKRSFELFTSR